MSHTATLHTCTHTYQLLHMAGTNRASGVTRTRFVRLEVRKRGGTHGPEWSREAQVGLREAEAKEQVLLGVERPDTMSSGMFAGKVWGKRGLKEAEGEGR